MSSIAPDNPVTVPWSSVSTVSGRAQLVQRGQGRVEVAGGSDRGLHQAVHRPVGSGSEEWGTGKEVGLPPSPSWCDSTACVHAGDELRLRSVKAGDHWERSQLTEL
ncbi:hypothetical protein Acy02nite_62500 [Actinoplanes cyaneus]|uniref:Uncharacterized protein n=1 Tax=Actinoplanes cyaneus TaxID=52696 RepID=A0A919IM15_9ACTN|nr:hypothetical protein Acy02nite_62500 [Actinoplanes cyaneus]